MEKLDEIKNELTALITRAYALGREEENARISKILSAGLDSKVEAIGKSMEVISKTPRANAGGFYNYRTRHKRKGHYLCQDLITEMMKTRNVIATKDAVKAGRKDGYSKPIVWRALRGMVASGRLVRLKTGLYGTPQSS